MVIAAHLHRSIINIPDPPVAPGWGNRAARRVAFVTNPQSNWCRERRQRASGASLRLFPGRSVYSALETRWKQTVYCYYSAEACLAETSTRREQNEFRGAGEAADDRRGASDRRTHQRRRRTRWRRAKNTHTLSYIGSAFVHVVRFSLYKTRFPHWDLLSPVWYTLSISCFLSLTCIECSGCTNYSWRST